MEIERYFEQIVDPTIADFEANPTSVRHAFLAAAAVFHAIDYLGASRHRKNFRENNSDFALVRPHRACVQARANGAPG